jgi:hypothetical protein
LLREFPHQVHINDFVDHGRGEQEAVLKEREEAVRKILLKHDKTLASPVHCARLILDVRLKALPLDTSSDPEVGFRFEHACHRSTHALRVLVAHYYTWDAEAKAEALAAAEDFFENRGLFGGLPLLARDAPYRDLLQWWDRTQPSFHLRKVANMIFSASTTQGSAERSWAFLARQN